MVSDSERLEIRRAIKGLGWTGETDESYKRTGSMGLVVPCPLNILHISPVSRIRCKPESGEAQELLHTLNGTRDPFSRADSPSAIGGMSGAALGVRCMDAIDGSGGWDGRG